MGDLTKMALSCELSQVAYSKIILHALKYPHTAINGGLLANEGSNSQSLKYIDAIPLFHNNLGLAPMLEVALMQIDSYCRTNGLVIAGYYQANETLGELGPDLVSQKICEKNSRIFPKCLSSHGEQSPAFETNDPACHYCHTIF